MKLIGLLFIMMLFSFRTYGQKDDTFGSFVEPLPIFPGGLDSMKAFIQKNIRHTRWTAEYEGTVIVRLAVNSDGSLTDLEVVRGLCEQCDKEALEVIRLMPKWIPPKVGPSALGKRSSFY